MFFIASKHANIPLNSLLLPNAPHAVAAALQAFVAV